MTSSTLLYDPKDPATIQDPIPVLRRLQDEDPVYWSDILRGWVVTRHEDVKRVHLSADVSANRLNPFFEKQDAQMRDRIREVIRYLNTWVAFHDPPEHTRLRNLMNKVFTADRTRRMGPRIEMLVGRLLDDLKHRTDFDFINDFAYPLPAAVIMDMLGVPYADMATVKRWSDQLQPFIGGSALNADKYDLAEQGAIDMARYFRAAIAEREVNPGDDLISALLAIRDEDDALSEDEVVGSCILFLFGGHETTTNLIGNGMRALMKHPGEMRRLRDDPSLIQPAVEEILRYDGPTGGLVRVVAVEHEMHGRHLRKGDRVFTMINAANHDPRAFEAPERFNITREPNKHLTFAFGRHFCLGAPLARLEGQIALQALITRMPTLKMATDSVTYMDTMVMRGVREMPVTTA